MLEDQTHYPHGWFAVAFSAEMPPGHVKTCKLAGKEFVLYRTKSGQMQAVRPHCPHLGAHLGHGGRVEGETIVCPFHAFAFDPSGACVRTGDGTSPPRTARLHTLPTFEANGLVSAWFHPDGNAPTWHPEELPTDGFSKPVGFHRAFQGHPYDLLENLVDPSHVPYLHGGQIIVHSLEPDGTSMKASLSIQGFHQLPSVLKSISADMKVVVSGVGFFSAQILVPRLGLRMLQVVSYTPEEGPYKRVRGTTAVKVGSGSLGAAIAPALARLICRATAYGFDQDIAIWEKRRFIEHPALTKNERQIMVVRHWAQQFLDAAPTSIPETRDESAAGRVRP